MEEGAQASKLDRNAFCLPLESVVQIPHLQNEDGSYLIRNLWDQEVDTNGVHQSYLLLSTLSVSINTHTIDPYPPSALLSIHTQ